MRGQKDFESYRHVPGGSQVLVTVSGPAGTFNADGQVVSSTDVVPWTHADLVPGPADAPLAAGRSYFVRIRVAFLAQAQATILLTIVKPDGTVHSQPSRWIIAGNNGQVAIRGAFIDTF